MKKLYTKYKEFILYIIFGVGTTLVNILVYTVSTRILRLDILSSTVTAWFLSVLFAYVTNRSYVFGSKNNTLKAILPELVKFFASRLFTGAIDVLIMYLFANRLGFNDLIIKIISNIVVVLSNYLISRWFIFRGPDQQK